VSVLLDTSVVIDVLRAFPAALRYAHALDEVPSCSEVSRVEILRGMRSAQRTSTERLFRTLRWVGLDESIARRAGELGRAFRRSHPGISTPDLVIAATADELDLELATLNVKHFPMVSGLRPPYRG
jgi:predicted nucleic acid-binding protein